MTEVAETAEFRAGAKVRLKSNPDRVGVLSGETVEHKGLRRWEVVFPDSTDFVAEIALEVLTTDGGNPFVRLRRLRLSYSRELRVALTHLRLTGKLVDLIYSLNTTNTEFYAYQFKPVLSFLDSPTKGLLIADEVGLGKTIEAGLVWTEMRTRMDAKRLLVICPAMLAPKWRRELRDRFGIAAEICNASELLGNLTEVTSGQSNEFAIICSLQGIRPPSGWQDEQDSKASATVRLAKFLESYREEEGGELFDLVVIDEAHYLRNPETQSARLARLVRPVADGLLLLSATPVQLRSHDLYQLLNLIDEDSFPFEWSFDQTLQENAPLVRLRDRLLRETLSPEEFIEGIHEAHIARLLGDSEQLSHFIKNPPSAEDLSGVAGRLELANALDRINPLTKVVSRTRKRDVHERRVLRRVEALRGELTPVEREFYEEVTAQVREFCEASEVPEGFLLTVPQRQMCSSMPAACRAWQRRMTRDELEELVYESQGAEPEFGAADIDKPLISELVQIARRLGDFQELRANDSKFKTLEANLRRYWAEYPDGKVVLFSYFRETLRYLDERLREIAVSSMTLMGGDDKEAALEAFERSSTLKILLSSEVASEGVDLQYCGLVINYDLPWNPMKIEQRIGRIDRIGQIADSILIWNILCSDTIDDRIYTRLFERLGIFTSALGATELVLGEQVKEMSGKLFSHRLSEAEEVNVIQQTAVAIEQKSRIEEQLEKEASQLLAHGDYLQNKINAARQMNRYVTNEDVYWYVRDFLDQRYPGCQFVRLAENELRFELELSVEARADFEAVVRAERRLGETGLAGPGGGKRTCLFQNRLSRPQHGLEVISQYHPLVLFVGRKRREEEQWKQALVCGATVSRIFVQGLKPGRYAFAVQRWSVQGERHWERLAFAARPHDVHDRVLTADESETLISAAALHGTDWLGVAEEVDGEHLRSLVMESVQEMDSLFQEFVGSMSRENHDYISYQKTILAKQRVRDVRRSTERIQRLREAGKLRTIPAEEGKLKKAEKRLADKEADLERKAQLVHDHRLVIIGAIQVE